MSLWPKAGPTSYQTSHWPRLGHFYTQENHEKSKDAFMRNIFGNIKNDSLMNFGYFPNIVRENVAKAWPKANSHIWNAFASRVQHVSGQKKHLRDDCDSWPRTYFTSVPLLGYWTQLLRIWSHFLIFHDFLACKSVQILANELFDTVKGKLLAKMKCVDQKHRF